MKPQQNHELNAGNTSPDIREDSAQFEPASSPMYSDFEAPTSTRIIGNRYLVSDYVGSGTRGEIYEAIDQQISKAVGQEQLVSIEILALQEHQVPLVHRFASQFAKIVNLPHPSIARSIDFGVCDQSVFFTMELLEGTSLRSVFNSSSTEAFSENEVLAVIRSTADALTYIHHNGYLHGNLTADSNFITNSFDVKIAVFASELLRQSFDNPAGRQIGPTNPHTPAEDVYGLAAIAYEMLSGRQAYNGMSPTQALQQRSKLRSIRRLSRQRRKALSRALALRPDKRTATVTEFVEEFGITGEEVLRASKSGKKSSANRILKPLGVLVAAAAAAAFLQPRFGVIEDKLSSLTNSLMAQVTQDTPAVEPVTAAITSNEGSADNEIRMVETVNAESTLSAQVLQSLESEIAEYIAQDDQVLPDASVSDDVAPLEPSPKRQALLTGVSAAPEADNPQPFEIATTLASSLVIEQITNEESVQFPDVGEASAPTNVVFDRPSLTVNESQSMAAISLRRNGNATKSAKVIWWTGENTARTDLDYPELGVRTEFFSAGQDRMTVYVPIISDSVSEGTESFYVYAQSNSASKSEINALEVFVVDDDG